MYEIRSKLLNFGINRQNKCSVRNSVNLTEFRTASFFLNSPLVTKTIIMMVLVPSPIPHTYLCHKKKFANNFLGGEKTTRTWKSVQSTVVYGMPCKNQNFDFCMAYSLIFGIHPKVLRGLYLNRNRRKKCFCENSVEIRWFDSTHLNFDCKCRCLENLVQIFFIALNMGEG